MPIHRYSDMQFQHTEEKERLWAKELIMNYLRLAEDEDGHETCVATLEMRDENGTAMVYHFNIEDLAYIAGRCEKIFVTLAHLDPIRAKVLVGLINDKAADMLFPQEGR